MRITSSPSFFFLFCADPGRSLRAQIVPSPEKAKKLIQDMATSLENEKSLVRPRPLVTLSPLVADESRSQIEDLEKRTRELRARTDSIGKLHKEVTKILQAIEECDTERGKLKEVKRNVKETQTKVGVAQQKVRDLQEKEIALKRQLQAVGCRLFLASMYSMADSIVFSLAGPGEARPSAEAGAGEEAAGNGGAGGGQEGEGRHRARGAVGREVGARPERRAGQGHAGQDGRGQPRPRCGAERSEGAPRCA